jgi:hypothetical protein
MKFSPKESHPAIFYNKDLGIVMHVSKYVAWSKCFKVLFIEMNQAKSRVVIKRCDF